jgi:hypothetical protein
MALDRAIELRRRQIGMFADKGEYPGRCRVGIGAGHNVDCLIRITLAARLKLSPSRVQGNTAR